jgi:hypothetical protein
MPATARRAWVPNTFPSPYINSELKPDQLTLILENNSFLKWFLDPNQVATHFLFQYTNTHIPEVPIRYLTYRNLKLK